MPTQLLGWRHLINWGRTLSVGGLLLGIPLLCIAVVNGNSVMTGAAESDVTNISLSAVPGIGAAVSLITAIISAWVSTGRISATDITVQNAFKQLAILALDSPIAANLLQRLKDEISPVKKEPSPLDSPLLTPTEYLHLLEKSVRQEVSKSIIK